MAKAKENEKSTTAKTTAKVEPTKTKPTPKTTYKKPQEKTSINQPASKNSEKLTAVKDDNTVAKAGKRSAKAIKESEEKLAKEERKASASDETKPKHVQKPPRTRLERRSKRFRKAAELIKRGEDYSLSDSVDLGIKTSSVKFDASVELHVRLNVDPKQADQNIRGTVLLPAGSGKTNRVAAFVPDELSSEAKTSGADIAGADELLKQLDKEQINFDTLIATPDMMAKLSKYAKLLGPKGLMPNPKSGTVTKNVTKAISEAKAGKAEYRVDDSGIIHLAIGKVSFGKAKLVDNANAVLSAITTSKPASIKGNFISSIYLTTAMGPSVKVKY